MTELGDFLEQMEEEEKQRQWAFPCAHIGKEMDEISDFITNGDIEGRYSALLVFEEAYVNVLKYAYPGKEEKPILVTVRVTKSNIEMVIVDAGIPFDPTKYVFKKNVDDIGEHGVEIIVKYSKKVKYKRVCNLNILQVIV